DGVTDLVVANGGSDGVRVDLGVGGGRYAPAREFFTGTDPVGVTVADVNADGLPDLLVANAGSDDVTVLLGRGRGITWGLERGPRLKSGGRGPVSVTVADVTRDGRPDLVVCNELSGTVAVLAGLGGGFFDDAHPTVFATGAGPVQALVGTFDSRPGLDLVTVNRESDSLTFFPGFSPTRASAGPN